LPDLDRVDFSEQNYGRIYVHFFNLKSAIISRGRSINSGGWQWVFQFRLPQPIADQRHPPNNGTIVRFRVPSTVTKEHLYNNLQQFGEIREIRAEAGGGRQRFVELWDIRSAETDRSVGQLFETKVSAEFSRSESLSLSSRDLTSVNHFRTNVYGYAIPIIFAIFAATVFPPALCVSMPGCCLAPVGAQCGIRK
jgi:hypothetical protein